MAGVEALAMLSQRDRRSFLTALSLHFSQRAILNFHALEPFHSRPPVRRRYGVPPSCKVPPLARLGVLAVRLLFLFHSAVRPGLSVPAGPMNPRLSMNNQQTNSWY